METSRGRADRASACMCQPMALYCTGYDTHAVFNGDLLPTPGYCNLGDLKKIKTVTSKDTIPENCKLQ